MGMRRSGPFKSILGVKTFRHIRRVAQFDNPSLTRTEPGAKKDRPKNFYAILLIIYFSVLLTRSGMYSLIYLGEPFAQRGAQRTFPNEACNQRVNEIHRASRAEEASAPSRDHALSTIG